MNLNQELTALMAAYVPMIHLVTYEEDRVLRTVAEIEPARQLGITSWDIADGFHEHRPGREPFPPKDCTTDTLLRYVAEKMPHRHILVLKDFHHSWNQKRSQYWPMPCGDHRTTYAIEPMTGCRRGFGGRWTLWIRCTRPGRPNVKNWGRPAARSIVLSSGFLPKTCAVCLV